MSEIKLKPCPFCGGEANIQLDINERYDSDYEDYREIEMYAVGCPRCSIGTQFYSNRNNAIKCWQQRAETGETKCLKQ